MKRIILLAMFGVAVGSMSFVFATTARADGTPKIQFETNFFDFGHVSAVETISGVFKFKNAGDGILKVSPPEPSCGCTDARARPDTLAPGESGEITYQIKLDHAMDTTQKHIAVHSNDPKTPDLQLTMQLSYTVVYEFSSMAVQVTLPAGKETAEGNFSVKRLDDLPLGIDHLTTSHPWISAAFDSSVSPKDSSGRVNVIVHRPPGVPGPFDGTVQLWITNHPADPVRTIQVTGEIQGEVAANPPRIYWPVPNLGGGIKNYPATILTRTVELKSVLGRAVDIKSAVSSLKGMSVKIAPKEAGKTFDLILKFEELPAVFTNGIVTIETSLASVPKLEVPLTIAVFK